MKKRVLHYKKSKIANAPDVLVHCINKYSDKYQAFLYAESGEYLKDAYIPHASQPYFSSYDIVHFHNRFIPCNVPKLIQYHSPATPNNDPPWADLSFDGHKTVIAQYQANLPYFKDVQRVRNIIDINSEAYINCTNNKKHKIRIGYSPSLVKDATGSPEDKGYNKTVDILNKVRKNKGVNIDVIQGVSLSECLIRKRTCDILIDECVTDSYHRCTLEGLAMGKMTICSVSPDVCDVVRKICGADLLVENIWIDDLEAFLNRVIDLGLKVIGDKGRKNRAWMEKHWHPEDIVKEFEDVYENVLSL